MVREIKGTIKIVFRTNHGIGTRTVFQIREISTEDESYERVKGAIQAKLVEFRANNEGYWFDGLVTDVKDEIIL